MYTFNVLDEVGLHVGLVFAHNVANLAPESDLFEHAPCKKEVTVAVEVDCAVHVLADAHFREDKAPLHN